MIKSGRVVQADSYQDMMFKAFGSAGSTITGIFQVLFALGCMCAYLLIIADNLTRVIGFYLPDSILRSRQLLVLVGNILVILPLSLAKDVTFLGKVASLSIGGNIVIALAVLLQRKSETSALLNDQFKFFGGGLVEAIGIISFSFVCHHNTFLIRESLETKSSRLFSVITTISVGFSLLVSLLLSIPAYIHFGCLTNANILNNFSDSNHLINVCRVIFACSLYVSFPLDCFVARDVLIKSVFSRSHGRLKGFVHNGITLALVGATTSVALLYEDLGEVLEMTGGVSATALAFIFPAAAYIKLCPTDMRSNYLRLSTMTLLLFGCFVLMISVISPLFKLIK